MKEKQIDTYHYKGIILHMAPIQFSYICDGLEQLKAFWLFHILAFLLFYTEQGL